jgi:hypothetical protein
VEQSSTTIISCLRPVFRNVSSRRLIMLPTVGSSLNTGIMTESNLPAGCILVEKRMKLFIKFGCLSYQAPPKV